MMLLPRMTSAITRARFNGWNAIPELATTVSDVLKLPPPVFVRLDENTDEQTAYRDAHGQYLESDTGADALDT